MIKYIKICGGENYLYYRHLDSGVTSSSYACWMMSINTYEFMFITLEWDNNPKYIDKKGKLIGSTLKKLQKQRKCPLRPCHPPSF